MSQKNTEQTYSAYTNAVLEFVSFHFRKFAGKAAISKTITIESHPVFMKGYSLKVPHSGFPVRWINDESHTVTLVLRNRI